MINLINRKVMVTGSEGFLGNAVVKILEQRDATPIRCIHNRHKNALDNNIDLLYQDNVYNFIGFHQPDYIIHCAGYNGGIEFNRLYPADILFANITMVLNLLEAMTVYRQVKKIVHVMTSCAYPDKGWEILSEKDFWEGLPNESIRAHGLAKRTMQAASQAYNKQYNIASVCSCITNLYGPNDTFNFERTKVVGALIRRFVEAKLNNLPSVTCWGTGAPKREFMYVDDAAEALVKTLEIYNDPTQPLNIGTGKEITIKELTDIIATAVEYDGEIIWDVAKGDGQMKKLLDVNKMNDILDYVPPTDVESGIYSTVKWYKTNKEMADKKQ